MVIEHSYVSPEGKLSGNQLGIHSEKLVSGLEDLSSSIHATGTPVVVQINHAGNKARKEVTGLQPIAPSAVDGTKQIRAKGIATLTEAFAKAADRAMRAGFDGVEVHGAHGFLLNQFSSPLTNYRHDKYGGSLENRIRFPLQVVERIRETIGGRLLLYRLGADDLNPKGNRIEDSEKFAVKLEEAGVDILDVSGGLCGSRPPQLQEEPGYFIFQAHQIKRVVNIPVIGVGGIRDPQHADNLIREGKVDLVAVGRALLNDPDWMIKAITLLTK
jgi:2,4-dienoyl-CoA reductase-like NADH-dependent reductase (Old Yellow Enzyme family)